MNEQATEPRWIVTFPMPPYVFEGCARDGADAISKAAATITMSAPRATVTFTVQDRPC